MSQVVTDADFDSSVLKSEIPVLVDFFAEWCGPCKMLSPIVDELASEYEGKVLVVKLDVDASQAIAEKYSVMSIPTLIMFKDGEEVNRMQGAQPKDVIAKELDVLVA